MSKLNTLFTALTLASCSSLEKSESTKMPDVQVNRLAELNRQIQSVGDLIWPGFGDFPRKIVLVDFRDQWALNIKRLSEFYRPVAVPGSLTPFVNMASWTRSFRDEHGVQHEKPRKFLANSYFPESTNNHFQETIFFLNTLEVFHSNGDNWSADDWVNISVHELFHNFQDSKFSYTQEILNAAFDRTFQKQNEDLEVRALLVRELNLLADAVCNENLKAKVALLKKVLGLRKVRWRIALKKFGADPAPGERFAVAIEGTARYAEEFAMAYVAQYQNDTLLKNDPFFENFSAYHKRSDKNFWCEQIRAFSKRKGEKFWYPMGFAYSLILDDLAPGWKESLYSSNKFFDSFFEKQLIIR